MLTINSLEKKIVDEYVDLLNRYFPGRVIDIILFGSKARGNSHTESDIDMLIVIDTYDKNIKQSLIDLCWDVMFKYDFKAFISPVVFFKKEYEKYKQWNSSFLYNVERDGVKL